MKVAIIGAGVSGLTCALELERHGIRPVIFEKRAHIGEALNYSSILPRILNRHSTDVIKYLKQQYGISLAPTNPLKRIIMYSPNRKVVQRGKLGYIFRRGTHSYSLEIQLLNYLDSPITFNKYIEVEDIQDDFDYIVVATSFNTEAAKLGIWTETFNTNVRMANVVGRFIPTEMIMWENTRYSKNAFCYLVPNGQKNACLVQIVNGISNSELDYYWKEFLFTENLNYNITSHTDTEHDCGFVQPVQYKNILFVGNAGGFTDDLLGYGILNAIESGILAAKAIALGKSYGVLADPIYKDIARLHELRKAINTFDNPKVDVFISILGLPILKNALYNNPYFRLQHTSGLFSRYNKAVKNRRNPTVR